MILDEPTAAPDPLAEAEIYEDFNKMVGGKTAIYISQRLSSCRFCHKIAVFSEGKIAEFGSHDELMKINGGIYNKMFTTQAKPYLKKNFENLSRFPVRFDFAFFYSRGGFHAGRLRLGALIKKDAQKFSRVNIFL